MWQVCTLLLATIFQPLQIFVSIALCCSFRLIALCCAFSFTRTGRSISKTSMEIWTAGSFLREQAFLVLLESFADARARAILPQTHVSSAVRLSTSLRKRKRDVAACSRNGWKIVGNSKVQISHMRLEIDFTLHGIRPHFIQIQIVCWA